MYEIYLKEDWRSEFVDSIEIGISYQNLACDQIFAELHQISVESELTKTNSRIAINDFYEFEKWKYNSEVEIPKSVIAKYSNFEILFVNLILKNNQKKTIELK